MGVETYYSDCQAYARSNVAGVSIQQSYVSPGVIKPPGEWAGIDASSGPLSPNRYFKVWGYPTPTSGQIPIIYDGVSPPTSGFIDIAVNEVDLDQGFSPRIIGRVNVYVISPGAASPTAFTATSTISTVTGDNLVLDNALSNNNPGAILFVQHFSLVGNTWNHPIAVTYDSATSRWRIRNEDGATMPTDLSFHVRIDPSAMRINTGMDNQPAYLIIDHDASNNNPYATIVVTPVSSGDRRMNHPFAVAYVAPYWQVRFTDGANLPTSYATPLPVWTPFYSGFMVKVIAAGQYIDDTLANDPTGIFDTYRSNGAGIDIVGVGVARASGNTKFLRQFCWTLRSINPIIVTMNMTPLPPPAPISYNFIDSKYYGVGFSGNTATVFTEDGSTMYGTRPFNVWGVHRPDCQPN